MEGLIPVEFYSASNSLKYQSWPRAVVCRPMVGDLVRSTEPISYKYGEIVSICHIVSDRDGECMLRIQLKAI